jgi:hypothetical protein
MKNYTWKERPNTELTGRSPLRRQSSTLDFVAIKEVEAALPITS